VLYYTVTVINAVQMTVNYYNITASKSYKKLMLLLNWTSRN